MNKSNFHKLPSSFKKFLIFNGALGCLILPAMIRSDCSENPLEIENLDDLINQLGNVLRQSGLDAARSGFGAGGENAYDIPLQILGGFLEFFVGFRRKGEYFPDNKISNTQIAERKLFYAKADDIYIGGRPLKNEQGQLFYTESVASYNLRRAGRILGGIGIVILAFLIGSFLKSVHRIASKTDNVSKIGLILLQGTTGMLFSFLFVFGMLIFSITAGSIISDISKKLKQIPGTSGKAAYYGTFVGAFTLFSVVIPAALLLFSKVLSKELEYPAFDKLVKFAEQYPRLSNLIITSCIVLSILFGISILGRRFLEDMFSKKIITHFASYNSLLGRNGVDDTFTNDAINDNAKPTWGKIKNENGEGKIIYIAIPNGYKLKNRDLVKIINPGLEITRKTHAYDADGNFYEVEKGKESHNKAWAITKLLIYAGLFYTGLFVCYGMVFCCGEFGEKLLTNLFGNKIAGIVINDIINNIVYLTAVLLGMYAITCLLKFVNIISFDKNFQEKIENKIKKGEIKEIEKERKTNEAVKYSLGAILVTTSACMLTLVVLLAEGKLKHGFAVPTLIILLLTIGRICMAFMTQATAKNVIIEEAYTKYKKGPEEDKKDTINIKKDLSIAEKIELKTSEEHDKTTSETINLDDAQQTKNEKMQAVG